MKIFTALLLLLPSVLSAGEVQFTGPAWNDPSIPLGLTSFYLQVDSPIKAKSAVVEMDLFVKGVFKQTIRVGQVTLGNDTGPLKIKTAIYFQSQGDKIMGTFVTEGFGNQSTNRATFSPTDLPLDGNSSNSGNNTSPKLDSTDRAPVFVVILGGNESEFPTLLTDTPKANPDSSVLIGYLKYE